MPTDCGIPTTTATGRDTFAIVIPAFNAARYLRATLTSALSAGSGLQAVIVVDDGSEDDTVSIAARFQAEHPRVVLIRQANGGVARARNTGLAHVEADYVCFLDADDLMRPGALDMLRRCLRDHPEASAAFGQVAYIDPASNPHPTATRARRPRPSARLPDVLCGSVIDTPGAVLFRTKAARDAGGFVPGLAIGEDWEMYVRVSMGGGFIATGATVLDYRVHPVSAIRRPSLTTQDFEPALQKVFGDAERFAGRVDPATLKRCELRSRAAVLRILGQSSTSVGRSLRLLARLGRLAAAAPFDRAIAMLCIGATVQVGRQLLRTAERSSGPCL